ncbi:MAG: NAD(P)-binding domain-containing protein [Flavobacteriaceae bacterium]
MKGVSILGCGWLGQALAQSLLTKGYVVAGSVRSQEKAKILAKIGVTPHILNVENEGIIGDFDAFIKDADVLIVAFPPGVRRNPNADYAARIAHILTAISSYPNCKILHLSSIGVFGASQGEVYETTVPIPTTLVGVQLLAAEKSSLAYENRATVVRLGGLVGDGRHPAKQLSRKRDIPAPNAPTNLVHQLDVVRFLTSTIEGGFWGHTLHCVSPIHHTRKVFYTQECMENNLPEPHFSNEENTQNKKVVDTKSATLFDFEYQLLRCRFKDC